MVPTIGTIVGFVFIGVSAGLLLAAIGFLWRAIFRPMDDGLGEMFIAITSFVLFIPSLVVPLIGFGIVNWNSDYLYLHNISGTVQQVASRQISDGKTMSTRYVFQINGQPYGVDDTRAALAKPGDHVTLNCTKEFVYGSTDNGWACNWGGN